MTEADLLKLEEIFNQAIEIPDVEKRAAFLHDICDGDRDLQAQVERLIRAGDEAGGFMDMEFDTLVDDLRTEVGERIGPYKLLQQIGEGGFGVVYMASQEHPVRRRVALKVIKKGMDTKEVIARFEAERQALALMDHPNIARVLDAGATNSGQPYFVMELVKGVPITKYCDENCLCTTERLRLLADVCRAVQHAHQKGIIHRDLKPSNILVTLHDGKPVPKVIDFGIAKAVHHQLTNKTLFTRYGAVLGTPQYMSPEQAELSGLDVDTRSDIYSLGVLMYELLTGRPPFEAKDLSNAGLDEMRRVIREEAPQRPSYCIKTLDNEAATTIASQRGSQPKTLAHAFKGDLDWIAMMALAKERERRYETAQSFAEDIERYLENKPVHAGPPSVLYRTRKFCQRRKGLATALGAVLLAVCIGGVLACHGYTSALAAEAKAKQREEQMRRTLHRIVFTLADADRDEGTGETRSSAEVLERLATQMAIQCRDYPEVEYHLQHAIGHMLLKRSTSKNSDPFERSIQIAEELWGRESVQWAESVRYAKMLTKETSMLEAARRIEEKLNDGKASYQTLSVLGLTYYSRRDWKNAKLVLVQACQEFEPSDPPRYYAEIPQIFLAQIMRNEGDEMGYARQFAQAMNEADKLYPARAANQWMKHGDSWHSSWNRSREEHGLLDLAELCYRIGEAKWDYSSAPVAWQQKLANVYRHQGRGRDADEYYQKVFANRSSHGNLNASAVLERARARTDVCDFESARPHLKIALELPETPHSYNALLYRKYQMGLVLHELNDEEGTQILQDVAATLTESLEKKHYFSHEIADRVTWIHASILSETEVDRQLLSRYGEEAVELLSRTPSPAYLRDFAFFGRGMAREYLGDERAFEDYKRALGFRDYWEPYYDGGIEEGMLRMCSDDKRHAAQAAVALQHAIDRLDKEFYPWHPEIGIARIRAARFLLQHKMDIPTAERYVDEAKDVLDRSSDVPSKWRTELQQLRTELQAAANLRGVGSDQ